MEKNVKTKNGNVSDPFGVRGLKSALDRGDVEAAIQSGGNLAVNSLQLYQFYLNEQVATLNVSVQLGDQLAIKELAATQAELDMVMQGISYLGTALAIYGSMREQAAANDPVWRMVA